VNVTDPLNEGAPRPRLLDLFCGAGGASVGYSRAGFEVVGWDNKPHPDYPFEIHLGDAMEVVKDIAYLDTFAVVAGSPPCPRYSAITPEHTRDEHPDFLPPFRDALKAWGGVYVIENVVGAPMDHPVMLCGSAFGLQVQRHRLFESNVFLMAPGCFHDPKNPPIGVYGDHGDAKIYMRPGTNIRRSVKARDVAEAQAALGIDWMTTWDDLTDAIPPAYTHYLGDQIMDRLAGERAA
jgi:DNA (cytosine-5)-methyltransferase 1